ncbi:MAG TPA: hypothetical protein VF457_11990 [Burkholderiaceae bacterium]
MTDPLAPPAAASAPVDPFEALCVLADTAAQASTQLFDYRRTHPGAPDLAQALNLEMTLDRRAIELRTQAVTLLGECAAEAVAQLRGAAQEIDRFLADVKTVQARFTVASSVIALAGAALVGDTGGILGAVVNVHDALKALRAARQSTG